MKNLGTKKLVTQRLILRKFTENDVCDMFANWAGDADVIKYLSWNAHEDINVTYAYIKSLCENYSNPELYNWGIEFKETGKVIGSVSAISDPKTESVHISFCIGKAWWNQKIMQETVSAIIPFFMEEVEVNRIESCYESGNKTAGKVLIRCGLQGEGTLRKAYYSKHGIQDIIWCAIMREDYYRKKAMDMDKLSMDNLYITNYRETGGLHLRSIMRLPKEEACQIAKQLSEKSTALNDRYGYYFERYYQKRKNTEEWLYSHFIKSGGKPKTKHPIYFVLCENKNFQRFFGNEEEIRIPLKDIASEYISFTPRDSMHLKSMGLTEGTVWNKNDFFHMMQESDRSVSDFIINLPAMYGKPGGYIEVQLWNDEYIMDLL